MSSVTLVAALEVGAVEKRLSTLAIPSLSKLLGPTLLIQPTAKTHFTHRSARALEEM